MLNRLKCFSRGTAPADDELGKDEELFEIYEAIKSRKDEEAIKMLQKIIDECPAKSAQLSDRLRKFRVKPVDSSDSLLHTAVLWSSDITVVKLLVTASPDIITLKRTGSFLGQTALHMTLEKKEKKVTEMILDNMRKTDSTEVFSSKATGSRFENNIMLGEIPLSVAVFRFDKDMFDCMIDVHGARIDEVNSKGDTIVHSLIKYAAIEQYTHTNHVIDMLKYINKKVDKLVSEKKDQKEKKIEKPDILEQLWFKENVDRMTPLKLAVKEGLADIVEYILNSKGIFCLKESERTPDTRLYDITEIDAIAQKKYSVKVLKGGKRKSSRPILDRLKDFFKWDDPLSVLEMLNDLTWKEVQPLLDIEIIQIMISKRWKMCRLYFWLFFFIHMVMMFVFTTSAYYRKFSANSPECNNSSQIGLCHSERLYSQIAPWFLFLYGLVLLAAELYRLGSQGLQSVNHRSNIFYRFSLDIFAVSLVVDCILYVNDIDKNDIFVIILLCGSFFILFFLRAFKKFSFYTVLFQKIIRGDLLRFGVIILIEFAAYSFAMYIVLSGNNEITEFSNFENTTLNMFNYMLGLKDLDILDNVSTETKRLVEAIYFLYILTTYVILINSLIAMMSRSADAPVLERKMVWLLQKSSVAIFLSVLPCCGEELYDKIELKRNRYYVEVTKKLIKENRAQKQSRENFTLKDVRREFFPFRTRLKDLTNNLLKKSDADQKETNDTSESVQKERVETESWGTVPSYEVRKHPPDIFDISTEIHDNKTNA